MKLSQHFSSSEFACACGCGFEAVNPELISLLEFIRYKANGSPITITQHGGCRCHVQNIKSKGAKNSQHLLGNAADIKIVGMSAHAVYEFISTLHADKLVRVGGLGKYTTFTHVDVRKGFARWIG